MLDWEQQIQLWRNQAIAALGSREIVAELESHLREAMSRKTREGVSVQDAWQASLAELGPLPTLRAQFALAAPQKPWLVGRCLGGLWVLGALAILSLLQPIGTASPAQPPHASLGFPLDQGRVLHFHVLSLILAHWTVAISWLAAIGFLLGRFLGAHHRGRHDDAGRQLARALTLAAVLFATGTLLGMVWSRLAWGVFWNNDPKEYACLVAFLGCFVGWSLGQWQASNPVRWALICLANAILAAWTWFGPMLWGSDLHAYGQKGSGPLSILLVFSVLTALAMGLAWLPERRLQIRKT